MFQRFSLWSSVALLLIILFAIVLTLFQFRFASQFIDRVTIGATEPATKHKFDELLTLQLRQLGRGKILDTMLANEEHIANIGAISISRCQVSQGQYNSFAQWSQFNSSLEQLRHPDAPEDEKFISRFLRHKILGRLNAPATGVSYYQASSYCQAAGGRLPSSDEWEAAASGKERRLYPWGDKFKGQFWRYKNPILNVVNQCDAYPESATPEGALDLGNSVSEWTYKQETDQAILKGGNAFNRPHRLHALNVISKPTPKNLSSQFVGFRCVFDGNSAEHITLPWEEKHKVIPIASGSYTLGVPKDARLPAILSSVAKDSIAQLAPALTDHGNRKQQNEVQVSRYEITVSQYAWFLRDPLARLNYYANELQPSEHSYVPNHWDEQQKSPEKPVTEVSWWDAYAFASWAGARLPTADEWRSWYGGSNQYIYPWGDQYESNLALVRDNDSDTQTAQPVNASKDANDFGLTGLAGNVSEWTSSLYLGGNEQTMIIKGGNFLLDGQESARVDYLARAPLYHRSKAIGFRIIFQ